VRPLRADRGACGRYQTTYVILTPAFNEAGYIGRVAETLARQTIRPARWVLVDDGSTDATPAVARGFAAQYDWMLYHRRDRQQGQAYFASNVHALMEGWSLARTWTFDFLAILDADITLPSNYYQEILTHFRNDPKLGIASGIYENLIDGKLHKVLHDRWSTPKAIQVFRRECFEQIGGFVPLPHGGEDTCACVMARMRGWRTWSFPEIKVVHHRPTGTGNAKSLLRVRFNQGLAEYAMGSHPVFVLAKCLRRCLCERPYGAGGLCRLLGFGFGYCGRESRLIPDEVVRFLRREQWMRVLHLNRLPRQ